MEPARSVIVLLVEDNADHAELTLRALKDDARLDEIFWVKDGEEALDFLFHRGRYASLPHVSRPSLILLDIDLPKINGHAVLDQVKTHLDLRAIPVVILTTSSRDDDVARAYQAGANSYVAKPAPFTDFMQRVRALKRYWTLISLLPHP